MDPALARARARLHPAYVRALDLCDAGATPQEVAQDLGIDADAADSLLRLAAAKLRDAVDRPDGDG